MTTPPPFSGSDLRDRMANERTLLAWVRTSIAFMAFGMAIAKFSLFLVIAGLEHSRALELLPSPWLSRATGAAFITAGAGIAGLGLRRTLRYLSIIDPHDRPPGSHPLVLVAMGTVALAGVLVLEIMSDQL